MARERTALAHSEARRLFDRVVTYPGNERAYKLAVAREEMLREEEESAKRSFAERAAHLPSTAEKAEYSLERSIPVTAVAHLPEIYMGNPAMYPHHRISAEEALVSGRHLTWARRAHLMAAIGPELVRIAQAGRLVPAATPAETARQERIIRRIGVPDLEDAEETAAGAGATTAGAGVAGGKRTGVTSPRGPSKRGGGGPPSAGSYSPA